MLGDTLCIFQTNNTSRFAFMNSKCNSNASYFNSSLQQNAVQNSMVKFPLCGRLAMTFTAQVVWLNTLGICRETRAKPV